MLAERLLADVDNTSRQQAAIVLEAGGNPYLLAELVRFVKTTKGDLTLHAPADADAALPDGGEITLDDVIMTRVGQLPDPARRLLEILAVFGRPLDPSAACRIAGIERQELEMCALLRAERFSRTRMTAEQEEIETYHDRIRETVVAHLASDVLQAHHRALALHLESVGVDPEVLAVHFQGAGEREQASRCAVMAADRAADALAFDRAATAVSAGARSHAARCRRPPCSRSAAG